MASKPKIKVTPILKKWTQNEDTTFDLDHPADIRDTFYSYDFGMACRNPKDIDCSQKNRQGYHQRSASVTSQFSSGTTGSSQRTGTFVHPFQQTPRPFTPPFSTTLQDCRANEINGVAEDGSETQAHNYYSTSNSSSYRSYSLVLPTTSPHIPQSLSQSKISASSLAAVSSYSNHQNQTSFNDILSSSTSSLSKPCVCPLTERGFRLRSRSEVIYRGRAQGIQEARRKFLEKEMVQEEKAAREEVKQIEKRQQKEAIKISRSNRQSSVSDGTRSKRSKSDLTIHDTTEGFLAKSHEISSQLSDSSFAEEGSDRRRNGSQAKLKTQSAWVFFVVWFRIRLLRIGGKISSKR